jgi:hypothetical protein
MSNKTNNISDNLFTTPIDDGYEDEKEQGYNTDESYGNLEGIISGLNVLMQYPDNKETETQSKSSKDDTSTKASSPVEQQSLYIIPEKLFFDNSQLEESANINLRRKKLKLSKCLKSSWKRKAENLKQKNFKNYANLAKKIILPHENDINEISCFNGKFVSKLNLLIIIHNFHFIYF